MFAVPVVLMVVAPVIAETPSMVPAVIIGALKVLFVRVCGPTSVVITPDVGKVALELMPVPPAERGNSPVTAAACARLIGPNVGIPPPLGITKLWYAAPAAVDRRLPVALPTMTPLEVKFVAPVPPLVTPKTPDPIIELGSVGISPTLKLVPLSTRPFASTCTLA